MLFHDRMSSKTNPLIQNENVTFSCFPTCEAAGTAAGELVDLVHTHTFIQTGGGDALIYLCLTQRPWDKGEGEIINSAIMWLNALPTTNNTQFTIYCYKFNFCGVPWSRHLSLRQPNYITSLCNYRDTIWWCHCCYTETLFLFGSNDQKHDQVSWPYSTKNISNHINDTTQVSSKSQLYDSLSVSATKNVVTKCSHKNDLT